ncbi:MAG: FAD-dependent oxidoreductase [Crocinitomicaceae bacterium]|nr:FAD-dependent oxidoreductase [Crocinitomicaceae bacterium]
MNRRKFLKQSSLVTTGLAVSPTLFAQFNGYDPDLPKSDFSGKVLIIGAGAAGLYAGYTLQRGGYDFEILEASDRIGGRMGKHEGFADHTIDLGAQWLHGKRSIAADLARKNGFKFKKDKSDMYFLFHGNLTDQTPSDVTSIFRDSFAKDISFADYAKKQGYGDDYQYIVQATAGSYGADADKISVKWTSIEEDEWSSGNTDYKFRESYWDVINKGIAQPIGDKIRLNTAVDSIDYSGEKIQVEDTSGKTYTADKVIITVPITILQSAEIAFNPVLPEQKVAAFKKIGMGPGMKVFLKFSEHFYRGNTIGGKVCAAYADDKEGKDGTDNVLLAFAMGDQAKSLSKLGSDEAIAKALLAELDEIYDGRASASFLDKLVIDYTNMPFIKGAYSYSAIGIGNARSVAAKDIDQKLYFAGEAMNVRGHHQTVHGALETGFDKVVKILEGN